MKIEELEKKIGQLNQLRWLKNIREEYTEMISLMKREAGSFCVDGFNYSARGDTTFFKINPNFFNNSFLRSALEDAVKDIDTKINKLKEEIEK